MTAATTRIPSPLDAIVQEAGRKLIGLQMTRIAGNYADKSDADNLRADLEALWGIVDPVILAIGEYARENFSGIRDKHIKDNFTDVLRSALEGNATFVLEEAGDEAQADLIGGRSEFDEHHTLHRAGV